MSRSVIGALRVALGLDSAQFQKGARQAEGVAARLGRNMQRLGAAMSVVGTGLALAVRGNLNAADELGKASQRIGVAVEDLSALKYAGELSDVSMAQLETGLKGLVRTMGGAGKAFRDAGIEIRDSAGNLRPVNDVLYDIADVMQGMPDGAEKTALAMKLFGRAGADMIPLLNGGSEALRRMRTEAETLGIIITDDTAKAAEQFNDNLTRLKAALTGVITQITAVLAPYMVEISDVMVRLASGFGALPEPIRRLTGLLAGLTIVVGPLLIGAGLLLTVLSGLSTPVLAVVGAVTVLTAAVVALWPEIVNLKDSLMQAGRDGVDWLRQKFEELMTYLSSLPERFAQFGRDIIDGLVGGIKERWEATRTWFDDFWQGIADRPQAILRIQSPSRVFRDIGRYLMEGLGLGIREASEGPVREIEDATNRVTQAGREAGQAAGRLRQTFESAFVGFVTGAQTARQALSQLASSLAQMAAQGLFRQLVGGLFGGGGGGLPLFGGARADGGPVSRGMAYLVGERGPELFVPGASGAILPHAGGAGPVRVAISLGEGLVATILDAARSDAVEITQAGITGYDRTVLPQRVAQVSRDPRERR